MSSGERGHQATIRPAVPAAARRVAWLRGGLASTAVDEVLLSILSLALALALIRGASKAEYGVFALVAAVSLLFRGAQSALVITPLATVGARLGGRERAAFVRCLFRLQVVLGVVLALVVTGGLWVFVGAPGWVLAVGSGVALLGNWLREFRRALAVQEGRPGGALVGDAMFAVLALAATLVSWSIVGTISAGGVLAAVGVAAITAAVIAFPRSAAPEAPATGSRHVVRVAIGQARWTFPGALIGWAQQSGYIYAVGFVLGPAAVGEMAAARLFVVPLLLIAVAWSRMFLPQATALLADAGESMLVARSRRALRVALVGSALYLVVPAAAFVFGVGRLLPAEYAGCELQVLVWGGFGVVNLARTIACTSLMARLAFRGLFAMTLVSAGVCLVLAIVLIGPLGAVGAVVGMTAGETLLAVLAWRALLARRAAYGGVTVRVVAPLAGRSA